MKWKNRDVIVLRPVSGGGSWTDDLVVVRVLESGDEETVRKGDIVGYTEDPNSDVVKSGQGLVGVSAEPNHPAFNAKTADQQLKDYEENRKALEEQQAKDREAQNQTVAAQAPVVQTVPFDAKNSTATPAQAPLAVPAVTKTTKK
jgi:hypothetical protein